MEEQKLKPKVPLPDTGSENYQLSYSNTNQQLHTEKLEEIAYDVIDHHITYHHTEQSHNVHKHDKRMNV